MPLLREAGPPGYTSVCRNRVFAAKPISKAQNGDSMHGRRKCVRVGGPKPEARAKNHLLPFFLLGFRSLHFKNRKEKK